MFCVCSLVGGRSLEESIELSIAKYKWKKEENDFSTSIGLCG